MILQRNKRIYVTACLKGAKDRRQGVLIEKNETYIKINGEGITYTCEPDYVEVPFENLFGNTLAFAIALGVKPNNYKKVH